MLQCITTAWLLIVAAGCASQKLTFDVTSDLHEAAQPANAPPIGCLPVARAIRQLGPGEFMVTSGDIERAESVRATLDAVLGKAYAWYPVVGNHDIVAAGNMDWLRSYNANGRGLPCVVRSGPPGAVETCYSFDRGNAHFVGINEYYDGQHDTTKGGDIPDALYQWLAEDLAANRKPIVFVFGHEPYLALPDMDTGRLRHRGDSLDANEANQHRFWTLLRKHGVTAFICGHTHCVSVTRFNGVWQLNCGRAPEAKPNGPSGFLRIRIDSERVDCDVYRDAGTPGSPWRRTWTERLR
jgi:predicted phosphodiesterase